MGRGCLFDRSQSQGISFRLGGLGRMLGLGGLDWGGCLIRLMVLGGVWFVNYEGPFGLSN